MFSFLRSGTGQKAERPAVSRAVRLRVESCEERNPAATIYGLTDANQIIRFDSASPTNVTGTVDIQGLNFTERVVGIDFRPRTGQLFGLAVNNFGSGTQAQVITVNPLTGATTRLGGPVTVTAAPGGDFGFDFNPTVDRIRVVNGADENLRFNPNNGARADVPPDTDLNPALTTSVDSSAYDRNFDGLLGGAGTTLYAINRTNASLVTQGGLNQSPSPNGGQIITVGSLGTPLDANEFVGFDIAVNGAARGGPAFATYDFTPGGGLNTGFYNLNLATGAASLVGLVGNGNTRVRGIAAVPDNTLAVGINGGPGGGGEATVMVMNPFTNAQRLPTITPFAGYNGAITVGTADFNRDSVPDVMVGAQNAGGAVKVFDGATGGLLLSTLAFQGFGGTISVAGGDVNGDGFHDLIVGADGANGHVKAFSGNPASSGQLLASFLAYPGYAGGVSVGAVDTNNDGTDSIVVAAGGAGAGGFVATFTAAGVADGGGFQSFAGFGGAVNVAGGDVNGDGIPDIVVGAVGAPGGHVKAFSGAAGNALIFSQLTFEQGFANGVSVGTADVNQDGRYEIQSAPLIGRTTEVRAFDGLTGGMVSSFLALPTTRGARVAGARF
jgi:hypothetical protein